MSLLLSMSLAGSLPLALHMLIRLTGRGDAGPAWNRRILKLTMFFFLCPFQRIKYTLPVKFPDFIYWPRTTEKFYLKSEGYSIAQNELGEYVLRWDGYRIIETVWLAAVILFVCWQMTRYFILRRRLLLTSVEAPEADACECLAGGCARRKWRRIRVVKNPCIRTPFTVGVWKHWIVLPDREFEREELDLICLHELVHIRSRDILYKMVCLGILLLHWFNPMAWFLIREYGITAEQYCDAEVAKTLETGEKRKKYARLLVNLAVEEAGIPAVFQDHFAKGEKQMKRRINRIVNGKQRKRMICPLFLAAAMFSTSLTVFAYQVESSAQLKLFEDVSDSEEIYMFAGEDPYVTEIAELPFHGATEIFIEDGTGKIYRYYGEDNVATRTECLHTYMTGRNSKHIKNSAGGCTVNIYQTKQCSKCGKKIIGRKISSSTFETCPHG